MDAGELALFVKQDITIALDDLDLAAMRVGVNRDWCQIIDVGDIPIEVAEYSRMIDRGKYFYFSQIHDPDSFDVEGMKGVERMEEVSGYEKNLNDEGGLYPPEDEPW